MCEGTGTLGPSTGYFFALGKISRLWPGRNFPGSRRHTISTLASHRTGSNERSLQEHSSCFRHRLETGTRISPDGDLLPARLRDDIAWRHLADHSGRTAPHTVAHAITPCLRSGSLGFAVDRAMNVEQSIWWLAGRGLSSSFRRGDWSTQRAGTCDSACWAERLEYLAISSMNALIPLAQGFGLGLRDFR